MSDEPTASREPEKRRLRTYQSTATRRIDRDNRLSSAKRGYGRAWRKRRLAYLRQHPLCVHCKAEGKIVAATEVDHVKPHRGDDATFWDWDNLQGLCKPHHSAKTGRGE